MCVSIHDGFYYSQIFNITAEFNYPLSKPIKQYLNVNCCPVAASLFTCFTEVSNTKTAMHQHPHSTIGPHCWLAQL
jgi:hypothetical protein